MAARLWQPSFLVSLLFDIIALTGWLSWWNGKQTVTRLALQLQSEIGDRIQLQLETDPAAPQLIVQHHQKLVVFEQLNLNDWPVVERQLSTQLTAFKSVSCILIGAAHDFRGVDRHQKLYLLQRDSTDRSQIQNYVLNSVKEKVQQRIIPQPIVQQFLEYAAVLRAKKTIGSPVFQTVDHQDELRSSEHSQPPHIAATVSQDPLVRQVAQQLQQQYNSIKITKTQQLILSQLGQRQLVRVIPYRNQFELDWLIAIVISAADCTGYLKRNLYCTVWLCLPATTIAWVLDQLAADCVVQPPSKLRQVRQAIADGNLTMRRSETNIMQEIQGAARVLNQMAIQLELSSRKIKW